MDIIISISLSSWVITIKLSENFHLSKHGVNQTKLFGVNVTTFSHPIGDTGGEVSSHDPTLLHVGSCILGGEPKGHHHF